MGTTLSMPGDKACGADGWYDDLFGNATQDCDATASNTEPSTVPEKEIDLSMKLFSSMHLVGGGACTPDTPEPFLTTCATVFTLTLDGQ
jgi:hypothetical protein